MKTYEVFIMPGYTCRDIEAENAEEAKNAFLQELIDNLDTDVIEANCLDDDDDEE